MSEKIKFVCPQCGGDDLMHALDGIWDVEEQKFYLPMGDSFSDGALCWACDCDVRPKRMAFRYTDEVLP